MIAVPKISEWLGVEWILHNKSGMKQKQCGLCDKKWMVPILTSLNKLKTIAGLLDNWVHFGTMRAIFD